MIKGADRVVGRSMGSLASLVAYDKNRVTDQAPFMRALSWLRRTS